MKIIKNPYLPQNEVSLFVYDKTIEFLKDGFKSYEDKNVLKGINTHPDMTLCPLFNGDVVVSPESYSYYSKLSSFGLNIIKGETTLKKDYPFDIAYNLVILGNKLFHNLKYTDKAVLKYLENKGVEFINVRQGYTKCSTLIVDENSVITCDMGLHKIYQKNMIDSLLISNNTICINNFNHGFIGGCGGRISHNTIGFFGDVTKHPDFIKIEEFLTKKNLKFKVLFDTPLFDYGSLIPLCTY
ncbi:MAG: hypothetical protein IKZ35_02595 [Clostridia bacterium]|nr:hypothetical protein [Clostridia bacterium]